jgi:hypothetical protein
MRCMNFICRLVYIISNARTVDNLKFISTEFCFESMLQFMGKLCLKLEEPVSIRTICYVLMP